MGNASSTNSQVNGTNILRGRNKKKGNKTNSSCLNCFSKRKYLLYGIDYLSDSEKIKENRKKGPHYFRVDNLNWSASYLQFLAQSAALNKASAVENVLTDVLSVAQDFDDCWPHEHLFANSAEWKVFKDYRFENLVMSGGGSKGYAYIGSLKALEDCGILQNIKRIAGSSAGAICAGLLAVGCSPQEIANVFKCDMKWLFHDQKCVYCCYLPRVCHKYYGVHPANRFYDIYGSHIALKVGNPDITFKELLEKYGCELHIVVTNLSRMCSEYCNPTTCPNIPVRDAVRMSMSFPVVFRTVRYNLNGMECLYTDGGILDQYPIHCFDDESEASQETEFSVLNNKTLGLYVVAEKALDYKIWQTLFGLDIPHKPIYIPNTKLARARLKQEILMRKRRNRVISKEEYMYELRASIGDNAMEVLDRCQPKPPKDHHIDITSFGEYFTATIETLLISQRKMHVKPTDVHRTVAINCGYIGTNDYKIEPGDRRFMITQGYCCTQRFLQEYALNMQVCTEFQLDSVPSSYHTAVGCCQTCDISKQSS